MEQLSFFEKLGVLFQNILAHPLFVCILLIPVFLIFFNKKITKKTVVLIYIAVLLVVLFVGNTTIFALFDNLMDSIFLTLYFPNFVTLFLVEVASAIICLVTFIKKDITKTSKVINITSFAIIQTLFVLILTIIQSNKIDIYKENALYANNDVLTLMQLLMGTFALQILTLIVIKAIDRITARLDAKEKGEVFERKIRLPEGRITHANLSDKVIIRKPQVIEKEVIKEVVKEPKIIEKIVEKPVEKIKIVEKEPEVKLDKLKPIEPLDKSLIKEEKINPLDLNEEIIRERLKPNKNLIEGTKKTKLMAGKKKTKLMEGKKKIKEPRITIKPTDPLDKALIKKEKINSLDLYEEIIKERESKEPLIEGIKRKKNPKEPILKTEEVQIPEVLEPVTENKTSKGSRLKQYISKKKDKTTKTNEENKLEMPIMIPNFDNVISESEAILREITNEPPKQEEFKFVTKGKSKETKKPRKARVKEEVLTPVKTLKKEKELIANLQIIDFDKTVEAIKDLKIVYTL